MHFLSLDHFFRVVSAFYILITGGLRCVFVSYITLDGGAYILVNRTKYPIDSRVTCLCFNEV